MKKIILMLMILMGTLSYGKESYLGYWEMPDGKFVIQIMEKNGEYVGYVRWLEDEVYPKGDPMAGMIQIDRNNPNKALRNRKVLNLQVVGGLHFNKAHTELVGGWIYDSWHGKKYYGSAKLLNDNTLKLRGSLDKWGILGYSMEAKRVYLKNSPTKK
ncbi:DUF2147 domain-containing protein [Cetobacterium ceti]